MKKLLFLSILILFFACNKEKNVTKVHVCNYTSYTLYNLQIVSDLNYSDIQYFGDINSKQRSRLFEFKKPQLYVVFSLYISNTRYITSYPFILTEGIDNEIVIYDNTKIDEL
jgi:hypothetical protein